MDQTVLTRQSGLDKIKLLPTKLTDYTFHVRGKFPRVVNFYMTKLKLKRSHLLRPSFLIYFPHLGAQEINGKDG